MATHYPVKEAFVWVVARMAHCGTKEVAADMKLGLVVFVLTMIVDSLVVCGISRLKQRDERRMEKWRTKTVG